MLVPIESLTEEKVTVKELIAEIIPLLEEVYFGDIICKNKSIVYKLPNGQKFKLYVSEIKD